MIEYFDYLGWELEDAGSQLLGICPFCGKDKMYVDKKKTTYHCKVCDSSGNSITALGQTFDEVHKKDFKKLRARLLAKSRGIPSEAFFLDKNLGWDSINNRPVWLVRKADGTPVTIRHAIKKAGKYSIRNMKGTGLGILGAEHAAKNPDATLYICEGEWDRIALTWLLHKVEIPGVVLSVPGAGTFKKEWKGVFEDRRVIFCYDKDEPTQNGKYPGYDGAKKAAAFIRHVARSVKFVNWPEEFDSYDVHDHVQQGQADPAECWEQFSSFIENKLISPYDDSEEEYKDEDEEQEKQSSLEPITSEELHRRFRRWLKLETCDLIDITVGALYTTYLPGDPLWLFIVAPPSGSKTESLSPCSYWYPVHPVSTVTAKSLVSGFHGNGGEDPSLFSKIDGKQAALIIKDLTPLLEGNPNDRDEVFGLLRDAYDGSTKKLFGNGVCREYNHLNFALIAGVTPAIDVYHGVAMGERFLKFRADKELARHDDRERAYQAIMNSDSAEDMREDLKDACLRALAKPFDIANVPKAKDQSQRYHDFIVDMAEFCAMARAVAPFDRYSGVQEMAPVQEALPRLAKQFIKLSQGLALHYGTKTLDDKRIMRLIKRIAIHTPDVITVRIIRLVADAKRPISITDLFQKSREVSRETMRDVLVKLERTKICNRVENKLEGGSLYTLGDRMTELVERSNLFANLPKNDPFYLGKRFKLKNPVR